MPLFLSPNNIEILLKRYRKLKKFNYKKNLTEYIFGKRGYNIAGFYIRFFRDSTENTEIINQIHFNRTKKYILNY